MSQLAPLESQTTLLRAWHLAILRFALTRDNADRLGVLAIANEIDRLGQAQGNEPHFSFFRRTSTKLSAAILRRQQEEEAILNGYLAQIDDTRLRHAFAAACDVPQSKTQLASRRVKPNLDLWRGLSPRAQSLRR